MFRAAMAELAALLVGEPPVIPTLPPVDRTERYLPTLDDLVIDAQRHRVWARDKVAAYLVEVQGRWARAEAQGLLDVVTAIGTATFRPPLPPAALVGSTVDAFAHLLTFDDPDRPTALAVELMTLHPDLDAAKVVAADLVATPASLREVVPQLRFLDDLLIRVLAAKQAVDRVPGSGLADALALYRVEGNLASPRSAASVKGGIPPVRGPRPELTVARVEIDGAVRRPNLSQLTCLFDAADVAGRPVVKLQAAGLISFLLHLAGLDTAVEAMVDGRYVDWARDNWTVVLTSPPSATFLDARATRLDRIQFGMSVDVAGRGPDGTLQQVPYGSGMTAVPDAAVVIAPADPEDLVAFALEEGLAFYRRLSHPVFGVLGLGHAPATPHATAELSYVLYNLGTEKTMAFLVSAVAYAHRAGSGASTALREAIQADAGFRARMDAAAAEIGGLSAAAAAGEYWADVQRWLRGDGDPDVGRVRYALVNDWVATAPGDGPWPSWNDAASGSPRGNAARFRQLLRFYSEVI